MTFLTPADLFLASVKDGALEKSLLKKTMTFLEPMETPKQRALKMTMEEIYSTPPQLKKAPSRMGLTPARSNGVALTPARSTNKRQAAILDEFAEHCLKLHKVETILHGLLVWTSEWPEVLTDVLGAPQVSAMKRQLQRAEELLFQAGVRLGMTRASARAPEPLPSDSEGGGAAATAEVRLLATQVSRAARNTVEYMENIAAHAGGALALMSGLLGTQTMRRNGFPKRELETSYILVQSTAVHVKVQTRVNAVPIAAIRTLRRVAEQMDRVSAFRGTVDEFVARRHEWEVHLHLDDDEEPEEPEPAPEPESEPEPELPPPPAFDTAWVERELSAMAAPEKKKKKRKPQIRMPTHFVSINMLAARGAPPEQLSRMEKGMRRQGSEAGARRGPPADEAAGDLRASAPALPKAPERRAESAQGPPLRVVTELSRRASGHKVALKSAAGPAPADSPRGPRRLSDNLVGLAAPRQPPPRAAAPPPANVVLAPASAPPAARAPGPIGPQPAGGAARPGRPASTPGLVGAQPQGQAMLFEFPAPGPPGPPPASQQRRASGGGVPLGGGFLGPVPGPERPLQGALRASVPAGAFQAAGPGAARGGAMAAPQPDVRKSTGSFVPLRVGL